MKKLLAIMLSALVMSSVSNLANAETKAEKSPDKAQVNKEVVKSENTENKNNQEVSEKMDNSREITMSKKQQWYNESTQSKNAEQSEQSLPTHRLMHTPAP